MKPLAAALAVVLAIALLVAVRLAPPAPLGEDAPADRFSAGRARIVQSALASGGPRPTGSPANAAARRLLREALERAGYAVTEEARFACGRHGGCGFVTNVVGRRPGNNASASAVLLMAHHDSVGASPGASDDGVGAAAVVEAARALAASPPGRRPILVVLTDGEEAGLLGAEAFANDHPPIFAAVNVDARGGRGPSALFETSRDAAWLVDLAAGALDRPVTSSLFFEVYKRMPNDTDFTVVKPFAHGVSLANIAGIEAYHTPQDDLAHADPGTLQHHGSQALALARALADAPDDAPDAGRGESVWFDVLSLGIVRWPSGWSLAIALTALALTLGHAIRSRTWGRGLLAAPASLLAGGAIAVVTGLLLQVPAPWFANAWAPFGSLQFASITAVVAVTTRLGGTPRERWTGTWLVFSGLGVVAVIVAPGASFLFTVPAIVAGLAAFLPPGAACAIAAGATALLWAPVALTVPDAIGLAVPAMTALGTLVVASTLTPLLHHAPRRTPLVALGLAAALALVSLVLPRFTPELPQRVNVIVADDGSHARALVAASWGPTRWGATPTSMRVPGDRVEALVPWIAPAPVHDLDRLGAPLPAVDDVVATPGATRTRTVRAVLRSRRSARTLVVELPRDRHVDLFVHGQRATPRWGALVAIRAVPEAGVDVELVANGPEPIDLTLYDTTPGVPENAAPARPLYATPTQDGDVTVTFVRLKL